ncbi:hypothetical protein Goklo_009666 [Gossypium klotzschianum]|uniref:RHOMBOID-like protein n=1 Tax=Gossypium klotzschianum TaxID=34286 RepID=A0A7J8V435_9ROSI|nr:hypothetical protein [Gossypium klotzschianum]
MAGGDIENRGGGAKSYSNSINDSSGGSYLSSSTYMIDDTEPQWTSWLVPVFLVANVAVFVVVMYVNNCPKHKLVGNCVARFLGLRIGILYLVSGFCGSVLSSLFIRNNISVGASGALFGLLGAMLSELITNWTIYTNKASALLTLVVIIVINLAIGILPHVDNFTHIGGFLTGFLLGFILLPRPQLGWLEHGNIPVRTGLKSKYKPHQYVLWVASIVLLVTRRSIGSVVSGRRRKRILHMVSLPQLCPNL